MHLCLDFGKIKCMLNMVSILSSDFKQPKIYMIYFCIKHKIRSYTKKLLGLSYVENRSSIWCRKWEKVGRLSREMCRQGSQALPLQVYVLYMWTPDLHNTILKEKQSGHTAIWDGEKRGWIFESFFKVISAPTVSHRRYFGLKPHRISKSYLNLWILNVGFSPYLWHIYQFSWKLESHKVSI